MLVMMAKSEGVGPLLYWHFKDGNWPAGMPTELQNWLRQSYYQTAANNAVLFKELERILAAFAEAEIPVIVLKGAVLAQTLYPDPGLRPMGDLDFLIKEEIINQGLEILYPFGYKEYKPEIAPGINQLLGYEIGLSGGPNNKVITELHWNLVAGGVDWRSPPIEWFWEQTSSFGNFPKAQTFTPEAHLLYAAAHSVLQHGMMQARLLWLFELHLMISQWRERLDWDELIKIAKMIEWTPILRAVFEITQNYFDTDIPVKVIHKLADDPHSAMSKLVKRKTNPDQTRVNHNWNKFLSLDWPTRLRLAWAFIFPESAYLRWHYHPQPKWILLLYYPYRWFDILKTIIFQFGKTFRGQRT